MITDNTVVSLYLWITNFLMDCLHKDEPKIQIKSTKNNFLSAYTQILNQISTKMLFFRIPQKLIPTKINKSTVCYVFQHSICIHTDVSKVNLVSNCFYWLLSTIDTFCLFI